MLRYEHLGVVHTPGQPYCVNNTHILIHHLHTSPMATSTIVHHTPAHHPHTPAHHPHTSTPSPHQHTIPTPAHHPHTPAHHSHIPAHHPHTPAHHPHTSTPSHTPAHHPHTLVHHPTHQHTIPTHQHTIPTHQHTNIPIMDDNRAIVMLLWLVDCCYETQDVPTVSRTDSFFPVSVLIQLQGPRLIYLVWVREVRREVGGGR